MLDAGSILVGDVGGTNARFAVYAGNELGEVEVMDTASFVSLTEVLLEFRRRRGRALPDVAAIGLAGPASGSRLRLSNSSMLIDADDAARELGLQTIRFYNDFRCVARALVELGPDDTQQIGGGVPAPGGARAIVGPGTGLGIVGLLPGSAGWQVVESEAGHSPIAGCTSDERSALDFVFEETGSISAESVLSGQGLERLLRHVETSNLLDSSRRTAAEVTAAAWTGADPHARKALDLFYRFLGTAASSAALTFCARGGVYLAGGIVGRSPAALAASRFRESFERHSAHHDYLRRVPVFLVLHPNPGLLGAARLALDEVSSTHAHLAHPLTYAQVGS